MAQQDRSLPTLPGPGLDVLSTVEVKTELYGDYICLVRAINRSGVFLQTLDLLPLGTEVRFRFTDEAGAVIFAVGVVRSHHYINYTVGRDPRCLAGMSIRFKRFEAEKGQRTTGAGQQTLQ